MNNPYLKSSGLNNHFIGKGLSFTDYITQTQDMITKARPDSHSANFAKILEMNSPFSWSPTHEPTEGSRRGVLLVHGLYDSPFSLMDLGKHLLAQGFWVRAVLLPGHGTVPGDLLSVNYQSWLDAVQYGIDSFPVMDQLWLAGFSVGGSLVINAAIRQPKITGLILISPALQLVEKYSAQLAGWHSLISWAWPAALWYQRCPQTNWVKYQSYPLNAAHQAYLLTTHTQRLLQRYSLTMPVFIAQSAHDETVTLAGTLNFFKKMTRPENQFILYQREMEPVTDPRIEIRNSYFPEQRILDFSHVCLPFAPDNFYYGQHGEFRDFSHYPHCVVPKTSDPVFLGSAQGKKLAHYIIQRLTYNPDFATMSMRISEFLRLSS